MGDYEDYHMIATDGQRVAGMIHAGGIYADHPPQWLIYITVADLAASMGSRIDQRIMDSAIAEPGSGPPVGGSPVARVAT
jgi:hypothetical protein